MVGLIGSYILKQNRTMSEISYHVPSWIFVWFTGKYYISSCVVATTGKSVLSEWVTVCGKSQGCNQSDFWHLFLMCFLTCSIALQSSSPPKYICF